MPRISGAPALPSGETWLDVPDGYVLKCDLGRPLSLNETPDAEMPGICTLGAFAVDPKQLKVPKKYMYESTAPLVPLPPLHVIRCADDREALILYALDCDSVSTTPQGGRFLIVIHLPLKIRNQFKKPTEIHILSVSNVKAVTQAPRLAVADLDGYVASLSVMKDLGIGSANALLEFAAKPFPELVKLSRSGALMRISRYCDVNLKGQAGMREMVSSTRMAAVNDLASRLGRSAETLLQSQEQRFRQVESFAHLARGKETTMAPSGAEDAGAAPAPSAAARDAAPAASAEAAVAAAQATAAAKEAARQARAPAEEPLSRRLFAAAPKPAAVGVGVVYRQGPPASAAQRRMQLMAAFAARHPSAGAALQPRQPLAAKGALNQAPPPPKPAGTVKPAAAPAVEPAAAAAAIEAAAIVESADPPAAPAEQTPGSEWAQALLAAEGGAEAPQQEVANAPAPARSAAQEAAAPAAARAEAGGAKSVASRAKRGALDEVVDAASLPAKRARVPAADRLTLASAVMPAQTPATAVAPAAAESASSRPKTGLGSRGGPGARGGKGAYKTKNKLMELAEQGEAEGIKLLAQKLGLPLREAAAEPTTPAPPTAEQQPSSAEVASQVSLEELQEKDELIVKLKNDLAAFEVKEKMLRDEVERATVAKETAWERGYEKGFAAGARASA